MEKLMALYKWREYARAPENNYRYIKEKTPYGEEEIKF